MSSHSCAPAHRGIVDEMSQTAKKSSRATTQGLCLAREPTDGVRRGLDLLRRQQLIEVLSIDKCRPIQRVDVNRVPGYPAARVVLRG